VGTLKSKLKTFKVKAYFEWW